jgi:hypothetical protein
MDMQKNITSDQNWACFSLQRYSIIASVSFFGTWRFLVIAAHRKNSVDSELVNSKHARQVAGVLSLLISMVGPRTTLGIILQQARCEVASLLRSQCDTISNQSEAA